jgi:hypothetical protein
MHSVSAGAAALEPNNLRENSALENEGDNTTGKASGHFITRFF